MLLFEKLLLILKKKDAKRYNYKAHIVVSVYIMLCTGTPCYRGLYSTLVEDDGKLHVSQVVSL